MPSGPCVICGAINYPLSLGGPAVCPSCDCGPPNPVEVRKLREACMALRTQLQTITARLEAAEGLLWEAIDPDYGLNDIVLLNQRIKVFLIDTQKPGPGMVTVKLEDLEEVFKYPVLENHYEIGTEDWRERQEAIDRLKSTLERSKP